MAKRGKNEEITLGKRIQSLRTDRGISMNELAKRVKVSHVQISNYESDAQSPTSAVLLNIANELETTADFLLKGSPTDELTAYFEKVKTLSGVEQLKILEYLRERFEMSEYRKLKSKQFGEVIEKNL
ncbi:MAG TPA: helix-turn-helix transcriptional regulator [Cyclobacteriaceae bacterium]|nr:helix-turn-helix domain-containing protein [Cyclobacteriaceae bacterium]HMV07489.1 helix-turn-helix transcriptional regulator [Cyclobacteriaceae bacterium]HMW99156.1 helix-turn-helix transcriptional regulator [Cyclobacteriaceae bacterium]HMX48211.1 helix-turn-helix transcriptional regulator [Cyclobacteriaceae bacterium]HMY95016.1 helix-turn-helix transcriptional regulator [Cyclobacteriaceae bacterium]